MGKNWRCGGAINYIIWEMMPCDVVIGVSTWVNDIYVLVGSSTWGNDVDVIC
jgi:hypothetical protein